MVQDSGHPAEVRSIAGWGTAAMVAIVTFTLAYLVDTFVPLVDMWVAAEVAASGGGLPGAVATLVRVAVSVLLVGSFAVAALSFLVWLARARANLNVFPDTRPRLAAGFTVGVWFMPLANLVGPPVVVGEIAAASAPRWDTGPGPTARRPGRLTALVWTWWTLFLLAWVTRLVGLVTSRTGPDSLGRLRDDLADGRTVDAELAVSAIGGEILAQLPAAALFVAAATAALLLIAGTTQAQYVRMEALRPGRSGAVDPAVGATI